VEDYSLLIVEDDVDLLTLYHEIACIYFDHIYVSSSLTEALTYLKRYTISAFIVDINLPDGVGLSLLESYKVIPAIIISGNTSSHIMQKAIDLSVYKFLIQPDDLKDLHTTFEDFKAHVENQKRIRQKILRIEITPHTEKELRERYKLTNREINLI
jgi:response regulator of citrate/malate metabolism